MGRGGGILLLTVHACRERNRIDESTGGGCGSREDS